MLVDDTAMNGLIIRYCHSDNWYQQEEVSVEEGNYGEWGEWVMCDANNYIYTANLGFQDSQEYMFG